MSKESRKKPKFELDKSKFMHNFEICWICKNRQNCPLDWECETIENLDNDDTNNGVDEA